MDLARAFAKELAAELDLPVYLYDRAALTPERARARSWRAQTYFNGFMPPPAQCPG